MVCFRYLFYSSNISKLVDFKYRSLFKSLSAGRGRFAEVWKGTLTQDDKNEQTVSVKVFQLRNYGAWRQEKDMLAEGWEAWYCSLLKANFILPFVKLKLEGRVGKFFFSNICWYHLTLVFISHPTKVSCALVVDASWTWSNKNNTGIFQIH